MKSRIVLAAILVSAGFAQSSGTITTIAGTGGQGYSGDGGPATAAQMSNLTQLALDSSGNLYFGDPWNHRVRRITPDGLISTVAGMGNPGYSGDGGPATAAQINNPSGVAVDAAGNLFIADLGNCVIRKVVPDGTISTFAGNGAAGYLGDHGPARSAALSSYLMKLVVRGGNLYIADTGNGAIRVVTPDGTISTVAGNGTFGYSGDGGPATGAQLNIPFGMTFDAAGNMYIADTFNNAIRKVGVDGVISTVAGNGIAAYTGDGGPASSSQLFYPEGLTFDQAGNLYIADTRNSVIRRISTDGTIRTIAGTGISGYTGDHGPVGSAQLYFPQDVVFDPARNLYLADTYNYVIRKVAPMPATIFLSGLTTVYNGQSQCPVVTTVPAGLSYTLTGCGKTDAAPYPVTAQISDGQYQPASVSGTFIITPATASVNWSNLTASFDGNPTCPTVTTVPAGLNYSLTGCPQTLPGSYPVSVTINDRNFTGSDQKLLVISNSGLVVVTLSDSAGHPLQGGAVQYYSGSWKTFGTTDATGRSLLALPAGTYAFAMTYAYGRVQFNQNVGVNPLVSFRTSRVQVTLQDSLGRPLETGSVEYYAGAWRTFGSGSTSGGQAIMELLPTTYNFAMTYSGGRVLKSQDVTLANPVAFQTVAVLVQLQDSTGNPLETGTVQYYSDAWRTFGGGSTSGGGVSMELLPASYSFAMSYAGGRIQKAQDLSAGRTIVFQTGAVHSLTCSSYYATSWRPFGDMMQLLPAAYSFRFKDGFPDTVYTIQAGSTTSIH